MVFTILPFPCGSQNRYLRTFHSGHPLLYSLIGHQRLGKSCVQFRQEDRIPIPAGTPFIPITPARLPFIPAQYWMPAAASAIRHYRRVFLITRYGRKQVRWNGRSSGNAKLFRRFFTAIAPAATPVRWSPRERPPPSVVA